MKTIFKIGAVVSLLMTLFFLAGCGLPFAAKPAQEEYRVIREDGIEVRVGETQVIIPMHKVECICAQMFKYKNGDIALTTSWGQTGHAVRSRDGGRTWQKATSMRSSDGGKSWQEGLIRITDAAYQFPNGEIMMFNNWFGEKTETDGVYNFPILRWTENGRREVEDTATVILPTFMTRRTKDGKLTKHERKGIGGPWPNHSIVMLSDGSLMASVQGRMPQDIIERTFVIRSTDRGKTWNFLSSVAFDLRGMTRRSGFGEPELLVVPNGNILCFMRSSGSPVYMAISNDDGKTWSLAEPITEFGVYPNACLMENGVVALCYGRPGNWITFSPDNGKTWVCNFKLNDDGSKGINCTHYNSIEEAEPGKLLLVYGRTDTEDPSQCEIVGTYLYVRRTEYKMTYPDVWRY